MEDNLVAETPATILDVLNEDCWWAILDLIHIKDIIRSERVSRRWQNVIFRYLQGAHLSIEYPWYRHETRQNLRILTMDKDDPGRFHRLTRKWGQYIKKADCINRASLKLIAEHCPNLEDITFYGLHDFVLLMGAQHNFTRLKRVHFRGCEYVTDNCISKWLKNDTLEELAISGSDLITGQFLCTLQSNLKTLYLRECTALEFRYLASADGLTSLTKLELKYLPQEIFENVVTLLDKLPNLEELCLNWEKRMMIGNELPEGISRLGLRRLDLSFTPNVSDGWLEIIARGCGRLEELVVEECSGVSARGVAAVCAAAGAALRALRLGFSGQILDHHVAGFVAACPNLTSVL